MQIILMDTNEKMVEAWREICFPEKQPGYKLDISAGNIFKVKWEWCPQQTDEETGAVHTGYTRKTPCIVLPGNSFGLMDGGIDYVAKSRFSALEQLVRSGIRNTHFMFMPVGNAFITQTDEQMFIYSPTMECPRRLPKDTTNVFNATWAALCAAAAYGVTTLAFPGMGTGVGGLDYDQAAHQMDQAFTKFWQHRKEFPTSGTQSKSFMRELVE